MGPGFVSREWEDVTFKVKRVDLLQWGPAS